MTEANITPDDPRLTAYALGELEEAELAVVEAAVAADPDLKKEVEQIRALAGGLDAALASEPLPAVEPAELHEPAGERIEFPMGHRKRRVFPYYWVSGLAAAGFAVLVMVQSPESPLAGREGVAVNPPASPRPAPAMNQAAPGADAPAEASAEEVMVLEPFAVDAAKTEYAATSTISGSGPMTGPNTLPAAPAPVPLADAPPPEVTSDLQGVEVEQIPLGRPIGVIATPKTSAVAEESTLMSSTTIVSENRARTESGQQIVEHLQKQVQPTTTAPPTMANYAQRRQLSRDGYLAAATLAMPVGANPDYTTGESYAARPEHGWKQVSREPLSTFAVDVDTASYANVRRFLQGGRLPPIDAVKIEEMVNAFTYDYQSPPLNTQAPLQANLEVASAPWAPQHRLVRIGLKAREMTVAERAPANLVFLLDVSGSMNNPRKLPLVKEAMRMMLDQLEAGDRVAIVTYAGQSGLALPSTDVAKRQAIQAALASLRPGGSTHGSSGIHLAYDVAKANLVPGGINRVILCTDGDFNVGTTGLSELQQLIAEKAESGVYLTALGFGSGNYQDDTLETLANRGNGQHGYIDSVREARRLLVEQVNGTLATVAQDVKIQVEFNPALVQSYRLIGYNNRRLAAEEFNDDTVDAGEIGAGHTVTALYEVVPVDAPAPIPAGSVDSLRYQSVSATDMTPEHAHELMVVKLRAQPPGGGRSELHEFPLIDGGTSFEQASPDFKFAAAVAGFGIQLRQLPAGAQFSLAEVGNWARAGIHSDPGGYRREFLELVTQADTLSE